MICTKDTVKEFLEAHYAGANIEVSEIKFASISTSGIVYEYNVTVELPSIVNMIEVKGTLQA